MLVADKIRAALAWVGAKVNPVAKAVAGAVVPAGAVLVALGVVTQDQVDLVAGEVVALAGLIGGLTGGTVWAVSNRG